ncbi:hypothetical protein AAZX31_12G120700 [Glycine max]
MRQHVCHFPFTSCEKRREEKRWSGTAGVQKRLRKSQKRQGAMQFVFCLFFYFNEKKNSNDVSKIFVGLFLFTSYPLCSSQQQTQRSLARFIILLCTLIHLPSTTPSSSSSSFSSLNPTCSTTFSPSNDGPLRSIDLIVAKEKIRPCRFITIGLILKLKYGCYLIVYPVSIAIDKPLSRCYHLADTGDFGLSE